MILYALAKTSLGRMRGWDCPFPGLQDPELCSHPQHGLGPTAGTEMLGEVGLNVCGFLQQLNVRRLLTLH